MLHLAVPNFFYLKNDGGLGDLGNPSMQQISPPPPKAFLRSEIGALAGCSFMFGLLIRIETQQLNFGFYQSRESNFTI